MTTETTVQQPTPSKCKGKSSMPIPTLLMAALAEAGMRGIFVGTFAGGLCPGGPYVSQPMEVDVLGRRFTAVRTACTFFFPPVAGMIADLIVKSTS